jgi:hypothetical protein
MRNRGVALAGTAVLVTALAAAPAAAAGGSTGLGEAAIEGSGEHCAVGAEPIESTAGLTRAALPEPTVDCFDSFAESIEFITGGELSAESPAELESTLAEPGTGAVTMASVLLGIEYKGSLYTGSSLALYGSSGSGCGGGSTYGFSSMPSGWSNVISSARVYANCRSTHYDYTSYRGSTITCYGACQYMGTMSNKTSSILFRP